MAHRGVSLIEMADRWWSRLKGLNKALELQGHWESGLGGLEVKVLSQNVRDMGLNPTLFHFLSYMVFE